jgi:hypothetical protein
MPEIKGLDVSGASCDGDDCDGREEWRKQNKT